MSLDPLPENLLRSASSISHLETLVAREFRFLTLYGKKDGLLRIASTGDYSVTRRAQSLSQPLPYIGSKSSIDVKPCLRTSGAVEDRRNAREE